MRLKVYQLKVQKSLTRLKYGNWENSLQTKEENCEFQSENLCLKTENKDLTERTNNLSYILADYKERPKMRKKREIA